MRGRIDAFDQQALVEFADGMGGAMNEKDLETKVIGQQAQVGVEDVHTLTLSGNIEKQMQADVDVGETSTINVNRIEVELQKIIDMIEE
jgi:hypothetical protein